MPEQVRRSGSRARVRQSGVGETTYSAGASATRAADPQKAWVASTAPAIMASGRLSVIDCRAMRPRLAPREAQIGTSRVRAEALASNNGCRVGTGNPQHKRTVPSRRQSLNLTLWTKSYKPDLAAGSGAALQPAVYRMSPIRR